MSAAVKAGYIVVSKVNTHRQQIKDLAGYSVFSDNSGTTVTGARSLGKTPDLAGTVIKLSTPTGQYGADDGTLGIDQTLSGELDDEIELLTDALGVADA